MEEMDLRDDIGKLLDEAAESQAASEPAEAASPPDPVATATPEPAESAEPAEKPDSTPKAATGRDPKGRFAPKGAAPTTKTAAQPTTEVPPPTEPAAPAVPPETLKAPSSWKPTAREKWAALPPEVQQEAVRLDREVRNVMQESAEARKFREQFQQTVNPYMAMIQAEGSEPLRAVSNLLQTAAALRTSPPAHKAQLVANLVKSFGVPIDLLDSALAGQPTNGAMQPQQQFQDPRVDYLFSQIQQAQQQRAQSSMQRSQQAIESFQEKAEFLEDVRHTMADMLEVAAKRGMELSLEDAYNRAIQLHPEIADIMRQREQQKAAANAIASTQRAKAAAGSSAKPSPAVPVIQTNKKMTDYDAVAAAYDEILGSR